MYKYRLIHDQLFISRTPTYDIHDLTRTCNSWIPSDKKRTPIPRYTATQKTERLSEERLVDRKDGRTGRPHIQVQCQHVVRRLLWRCEQSSGQAGRYVFPPLHTSPSLPLPWSIQLRVEIICWRKRLGVKSYEVSLDTQTATVVAAPDLAYETVLKTIKKTGKKVNTGEADGEVKSVEILPENEETA
jgi:hypothetical protein